VVKIPGINTISPNTGRLIQEDNDVVNLADMSELITKTLVVAGIASMDGSSSFIVDDTKNFEAGLFVGKLIKVTIDGVEYIRKIVSCDGQLIQITHTRETVAASVIIGEPEGPQLTITSEFPGSEGNNCSVIIVNGAEPNTLLAAVIDPETNLLTVTLATDGEGLPDNTVNTGMAVATAIDILPEFIAEMTGAGGIVTEIAEAIPLTGGIDPIVITEGTPYEILLTDPNQIDVKVEGMGSVDTIAVTDPDTLTANELGLLRGILKQIKTGIVNKDSNGDEIFTNTRPGSMKLMDSNGGQATITGGKLDVNANVSVDNLTIPNNLLAIPKTELKPLALLESHPNDPVPNSIDPDGNVYGRASNGLIFNSTDSCATFNYSTFDFTIFALGTPYYVIKTNKKYIVFLRDANNNKGGIVTSDSFDSGYVLAVTNVSSYPDDIAINYYHGAMPNGDSIILSGEYGMVKNVVKNLWASFDSGVTWQSVLQTPIVDIAVNNHFHHSIYDPYMGRIWATCGDGVNAILRYSDDLGLTWGTVSFEGTNPQPTILMAFPGRIVYGADAGNYPVSLWNIPRDTDATVKGMETFTSELAYTMITNKFCYDYYGQPPVAQSGIEAYAAFPAYDGSKKSLIVATGDGGNSWNIVYQYKYERIVGGQGFTRGLVGPDKNGFIFSYILALAPSNNTVRSCILKLPKVEWVYK